ncbi:MAG: sigma-70 family RNA polymerase sigma factor [Pirellulaceae bacterium]|nr:sigma-70 family RNA polymerase sigma factor [Pirellulaceae bacterium]
MPESTTETSQIQYWIDRMKAGDASARDQLIAAACNRLLALTRKIKGGFADVGRWEQTEDVFQNAAMRLCHALEKVELSDSRHFFRLAAVQIRRELIDMSRHYHGAHGMGAHHISEVPAGDRDSRPTPAFERAEVTQDPQRVAEWAEFHRLIDELPDQQREVFDLLWYHGLSQDDAAHLMNVSTRTVKRLWRAARLRLHESLSGELPGV